MVRITDRPTRTHLLLAGNDTVPTSVWRVRGMCSTECRIVTAQQRSPMFSGAKKLSSVVNIIYKSSRIRSHVRRFDAPMVDTIMASSFILLTDQGIWRREKVGDILISEINLLLVVVSFKCVNFSFSCTHSFHIIIFLVLVLQILKSAV